MVSKKTELEPSPTATQAAPPSEGYRAQSPILHDGKRYEIGASLVLSAAQAKRLGAKVVRVAPPSSQPINTQG